MNMGTLQTKVVGSLELRSAFLCFPPFFSFLLSSIEHVGHLFERPPLKKTRGGARISPLIGLHFLLIYKFTIRAFPEAIPAAIEIWCLATIPIQGNASLKDCSKDRRLSRHLIQTHQWPYQFPYYLFSPPPHPHG